MTLVKKGVNLHFFCQKKNMKIRDISHGLYMFIFPMFNSVWSIWSYMALYGGDLSCRGPEAEPHDPLSEIKIDYLRST